MPKLQNRPAARLAAALLAAALLAGCAAAAGPSGAPAPGAGRAATAAPAPPPPVGPNGARPDRRWVERTLSHLTLEQKIGQMVVPWLDGAYMPLDGPAYQRLRHLVVDDGVGGLVMSIGAPLEVAQKLNELQRLAAVPLLVASDVEHGAGMRLKAGVALPYGIDLGGATEFPPLMAFGAAGDPRLAYELGRITALESRAAGIQMAYAPDVDVNNNPANPIINVRSFGGDPGIVEAMATADIRGMQDNGLLATAKHFPGHGDTGTDSHLALPILNVSQARLDSVELPPFRAAVRAGVSAVMSAHIAFPALTGDTVPSTLSPRLLTGLLRDTLGFRGLVVTDALDMGGIVRKYGPADAAVLAVQAGADVLLMPPDVPAAIAAVAAAVRDGRIPEARIDASVRKLLDLKSQVGLDRRRAVDLSMIPRVVGIPAHQAVAEQVARRALTVGRDRDHLLPVDPRRVDRILSIVYSDDADPLDGRALQKALGARYRAVATAFLDRRAGEPQLDSLLAAADSADVVFFSPFVRVLARKGGVAIAPRVVAFARALAARRPTVVTSFGNPYLLSELPDVSTYVLAWGPEDVMQQAAAAGLAGEQPITGSLPIRIPPDLPLGSGVRIDALPRTGAAAPPRSGHARRRGAGRAAAGALR